MTLVTVAIYLVELPLAVRFSVPVLRSDRPFPPWLRDANPGNWHPIEWDELLDGQLGPWAMIVDDTRVVSLCHTPVVMTERSAECGTWTDPDYRGRGYAAATTAAWADVLQPSGRHLYYAHDVVNRSSQRVTQRLGLRLIAHLYRPSEPAAASDVHPLSSLQGFTTTRQKPVWPFDE
jgi:RimJ/RimL family protein N-acetyltransferase